MTQTGATDLPAGRAAGDASGAHRVNVARAVGPNDAEARARCRRRAVLLVLILALAAGLRVWGIGRQSIWFDEAATVHISRQPLGRMFELIRADERTPPLHYVILHGWMKVFGHSEASVRMPSAIAGTAAVWACFVFVRRLISADAALVAALLLALSRYQVDYAQEARAYSLMLLAALASCALFARIIERRSTRGEAAYVVATALLLYSHLYGVFVIAAQHVAYALLAVAARRAARRDGDGDGGGGGGGGGGGHDREARDRGDGAGNDGGVGDAKAFAFIKTSGAAAHRHLTHASLPLSPRRWLLLNVAVVALFSPWIPTTVRWARSVHTEFWVSPMTWAEIPKAFRTYAGSWPLLVALMLLALIGLLRTRGNWKRGLLMALALLPVVVPVGMSVLGKPTFTDRYGIVAPAAMYALAAAGAIASKWRAARVAVVMVLMALSLAGAGTGYRKPDWRGAGEYLSRHMRPSDIAVVNRKNATYLYDYYVRRPDVRRIGFDGTAIPLSLPLPPGRRVWLILHGGGATAEQILARGPWRVLSQHHPYAVDIYELEDLDEPTPPTTTR